MKTEIKKIHARRFSIVAGVSELFRFKSQIEAERFMAKNADLVKFWSESASASINNSTKVTVLI
jgi:hypothetical protein